MAWKISMQPSYGSMNNGTCVSIQNQHPRPKSIVIDSDLHGWWHGFHNYPKSLSLVFWGFFSKKLKLVLLDILPAPYMKLWILLSFNSLFTNTFRYMLFSLLWRVHSTNLLIVNSCWTIINFCYYSSLIMMLVMFPALCLLTTKEGPWLSRVSQIVVYML